MLKLCCTWGFCLLALALVTRPTVADEQPLKGVKVPEGFTATLFAGPPNVTYPTCVAAAPTSEVFIGVDENGSLGKEKTRRQNIVRCVDEDGDGRADKFNLFAENVGSVRGMFSHEGIDGGVGVAVTCTLSPESVASLC